MQFLHQMLNVSALLLDNAFKPSAEGCHETPQRPHCPHQPQIQRYLTLNKQQE